MTPGYYWFRSMKGWIIVRVQPCGELFTCCGNDTPFELAEESTQNFGPMVYPPTEH